MKSFRGGDKSRSQNTGDDWEVSHTCRQISKSVVGRKGGEVGQWLDVQVKFRKNIFLAFKI